MSLLLLFRRRASEPVIPLEELSATVDKTEMFAGIYVPDIGSGVFHMAYDLKIIHGSVAGPWNFRIRQKVTGLSLVGATAEFWVGTGLGPEDGTTYLSITSPDARMVIDTVQNEVEVTLDIPTVNALSAYPLPASGLLRIRNGATDWRIPFQAGRFTVRLG